MKKFILLALSPLFLVACNSGSNGVNSSDVQNISGSVGTYPNQFQISTGTATGCRAISNNGSCNISITYLGTGTYYNGPLTTNTLNGYTSTIANCSNTGMQAQTCNFTITNTGGSTSSAQTVTIYANGQSIGINAFTLGGGY